MEKLLLQYLALAAWEAYWEDEPHPAVTFPRVVALDAAAGFVGNQYIPIPEQPDSAPGIWA